MEDHVQGLHAAVAPTGGPLSVRPIDFLLRGAARHPESIALVGNRRTYTYGALLAEVNALAAALQARDPDMGSRVAVIGANSVDYVVALLATLAAGKVWVPFLPGNGAAEAQRIIDFTEASIVLADDAGLALLDGFSGGRHRFRLNLAGAGSTAALVAEAHGRTPAAPHRHRDDIAAIKFTGGSTGTPKGVMQPDRAWVAYSAMLIHHLGFAPGERTVVATPVTHGASVFLLPTLGTGGTIEIHDRADAATIVAAFANGAARTFAPPALINKMAAQAGADPLRFKALRQILYSAAPMAIDDIHAAQSAFGPCIATAFGQTEAPLMVSYLSPEEMTDAALIGTVGRDALLSRTAILDRDGTALPDGEVGEIGVQGDLVMTGYWRRPDLTEATFAGGWLRTGDLGTRDAQGYITIRGRAREMINTGGFKVFPGDVEAVLRQHAAVADCAVFGSADAQWGEAVNALVVLGLGGLADAEALKAHVRAAMGPVRTPKAIALVQAIPRNAQGKLQRHLLVREIDHD